MDFGVGFLTNSVMLPILDFLYRIVPNYGVGIVLLTLIVKGLLWPLTAGSIRSMRKMQVVQPEMQRRTKEIQEKYKNEPERMQQEMAGLYKEYGNPLAGCLPLVVQMPILFALFATLRGSPFADTVHMATVQVKPTSELTRVETEGKSWEYTIYLTDGMQERQKITFSPNFARVPVGKAVQFKVDQVNGQPFTALSPRFEIVGGAEKGKFLANGTLEALAPGDVNVHVVVPGIAAEKGFLFVEKLGRSGISGKDGIYWDSLLMIVLFGVSLYFSQNMTAKHNPSMTEQQKQINKITPFIFSGMFVFFPLPAGVLLYILLSNLFQIVQTYLLYREPLPENIQRILDQAKRKEETDKPLPFENKQRRNKKKA
ncbi:membrane protein insertase YidC [Gloeobacter violaceus]|uniref:Glr2231 protein n=1 Tax=Gloeobacter violaceus (strain ATCC 29082 / PCC 7421) TaxID=251221 RepID=Q7NIF2_GLOVI|nr:membrane protein insertase YidC [Gloeobacter violaceus]BAC90172.1 glr2231 [Gloeobacter violaceus PCC 7421]